MSETLLCRICGHPVDVDQAADTGGAHIECAEALDGELAEGGDRS